jgi:hypothetical protein
MISAMTSITEKSATTSQTYQKNDEDYLGFSNLSFVGGVISTA